MTEQQYVVGITGASGAPYSLLLLRELLQRGCTVHLVVTAAGWRVLQIEEGWSVTEREQLFYRRYEGLPGRLQYHPLNDIAASISSGSFHCNGMIVVPCTMGTLAKLAWGASSNLLERTADVMLKERRPLIVVPRETPLNLIHLQNMVSLAQAGAMIVPAMPAFYTKPTTVEGMVHFIVGKILDCLHIPHQLFPPWKGV